MSNIEKTICVRAWNYPIVNLGRDELKNCCKTRFNHVGIDEMQMGPGMFSQMPAIKNLKKMLLSGIHARECTSCWKSEEFGATSYRTSFDEFAKFIQVAKWHNLTIEEIKHRLLNLSDSDKEELINLEHPTHLEISISSLCDLKCIYCSPTFSSQWHAEKIKYKELPSTSILKDGNPEYENILWEWFSTTAYKTINNISFVGGEPLINDKFYTLVDKLLNFYKNSDRTDHINIFVATNLNTPKKYFDKLRDILRKVQDVPTLTFTVGISFESVGAKHEFIRTNSDWKTFDDNIKLLTKTLTEIDPENKLSLVIMPSFNSMSISDLPNFVKYLIKMKDGYDRTVRVSTTHVATPMKYSPFILTTDFNKYIDEAISIIQESNYYRDIPYEHHGSWTRLVEYLETIKNSIIYDSSNKDTERKNLIRELNTLKERRGIDYETAFPEMMQFFDFCRKSLQQD